MAAGVERMQHQDVEAAHSLKGSEGYVMIILHLHNNIMFIPDRRRQQATSKMCSLAMSQVTTGGTKTNSPIFRYPH